MTEWNDWMLLQGRENWKYCIKRLIYFGVFFFHNDIFADITKEENLSLSNESQYLLISRPSVQELLSKIKERQSNENEAGEQIGINTVSLKIKECFYFWKLEVCKIAIFFFTSDLENLVHRFRANLIVDGGIGYEEDSWEQIQIGRHRFMVGRLFNNLPNY